jgi:hypothetical protein
MKLTPKDMERALRAYDDKRFEFAPGVSPHERHQRALQAALDALDASDPAPVGWPEALVISLLAAGILTWVSLVAIF